MRQKRNSRAARSKDVAPAVKPKFAAQRYESVATNPIVPLNERQAEYMRAIESKDLIVATGFAGTSKTFVATSLAADALRLENINKIVLSRPAISNSQSLGFFPGDVQEKLTIWLQPQLQVLYKRLGRSVVDLAIADKKIELQPMETLRGMSYGKGTWIISDESQNLTIDEVKTLVTRMGTGSKLILAGDIRQSDLKADSGLAIFKDMLTRHPGLQQHIAMIDFDSPEHIVRSKMVKDLIIAFDKEGL